MSIGHSPAEQEAAIRAALEAVRHIKSDQKAADVLGTSETTVRRWRRGELTLRKPTREALERFFGATKPQKEIPADAAAGALQVIGEIRTRIEELEHVWRARLELARAQESVPRIIKKVR